MIKHVGYVRTTIIIIKYKIVMDSKKNFQSLYYKTRITILRIEKKEDKAGKGKPNSNAGNCVFEM